MKDELPNYGLRDDLRMIFLTGFAIGFCMVLIVGVILLASGLISALETAL